MVGEPRSLLAQAVALLSRREYSRRELARTLAEKAESAEALHELLDQLQQQGYQSDQRFCASFIRSRINRGHGPIRISQELKQRGVAAELIRMELEAAEVDWFALALQQALKRFGNEPADSAKEKAKRMRFLLYRGFDNEQSRYALEAKEQ